MSKKNMKQKINYISKMEKDKSIKLMDTINKVVELLDNVKLHITDNEYLTIMNELKIQYDTKDDVFNALKQELLSNEIIALNNKRTNYVVKDFNQQLLTDKQKLDTGRYTRCRCGTIIANSFLETHKQLEKCKRFTITKKLTVACASFNTHRQENAILTISKLYSPVIKKLRLRAKRNLERSSTSDDEIDIV